MDERRADLPGGGETGAARGDGEPCGVLHDPADRTRRNISVLLSRHQLKASGQVHLPQVSILDETDDRGKPPENFRPAAYPAPSTVYCVPASRSKVCRYLKY